LHGDRLDAPARRLLDEHLQKLHDEQGIAVGLVENGFERVLRQLHADRAASEAAYRFPVQAAESYPDELGAARKAAERVSERTLAQHLGVAVGDEDEYPAAGELLGQELEKRERRRVRPMDVVDHQ